MTKTATKTVVPWEWNNGVYSPYGMMTPWVLGFLESPTDDVRLGAFADWIDDTFPASLVAGVTDDLRSEGKRWAIYNAADSPWPALGMEFYTSGECRRFFHLSMEMLPACRKCGRRPSNWGGQILWTDSIGWRCYGYDCYGGGG